MFFHHRKGRNPRHRGLKAGMRNIADSSLANRAAIGYNYMASPTARGYIRKSLKIVLFGNDQDRPKARTGFSADSKE